MPDTVQPNRPLSGEIPAPVVGGPQIRIGARGRPPNRYAPTHRYSFRYRARRHAELPHVVKFSGGRSSGMLLFALLDNGLLRAQRGDVVVFNNTGAEHPATYEFVTKCKAAVESRRIPFFMVEFQTYEDARGGEWTRLPSYRLCGPEPWSETNSDGYHDKGEPFEEMLSWSGYVPNQFSRTCTKTLKLEVTRMFLRDWLASKESIPRLGHWENESQVGPEVLYRRHVRNRGAVPKEIFYEKKKYMLSRPAVRRELRFADFTAAPLVADNPRFAGCSYGANADLGPGGIEYVALIGLRGDEPMRVRRVEARAAGGPEALGYEGEHVYMPLAAMKVNREDVSEFWARQAWSLDLPDSGSLSNCVYCFLKGSNNLAHVYEVVNSDNGDPGGIPEAARRGPADIGWWARMEEKYGRDLKAERRTLRKGSGVSFLGFFGTDIRLAYKDIADRGVEALSEGRAILPCDCTD